MTPVCCRVCVSGSAGRTSVRVNGAAGAARNQLNVVILELRQAVKEQGQLDEVEQVMYSAMTQLRHVSELRA